VESDLLSYFVDRTGRAYEEQIWAVALVGAMAGFLFTQAERVVAVVRRSLLVVGVWATCILALVFIWSRHFIFVHYDTLARATLDMNAPGALGSPDRVPPVARLLAGWSGVSLYTIIVVAMTIVAVRALAKARQSGGCH